MFLIKYRRYGMDNYVFIERDPRTEGYQGEIVDDDVSLVYKWDHIHAWPYGQHAPSPRLGRDPKNPKHYEVFKFPDDMDRAGYELVSMNTPFFATTWSTYKKQFDPELHKIPADAWFDELEKADAAAKIRRRMDESPEPKADSSTDQIAEWVAKRHISADAGIREVWYLRAGSPADEIRLLEVSELYATESTVIEPIDYGLDIDGAKFKLLVADVTSEQLQQIKTEPSRLPKNWTFDDAKSWGRRA